MKRNAIVWLLTLLPFFCFSQGLKANLYDKFLKKQRVETEALPITGLAGRTKLSLAFTAIGSSLYLDVHGTGWGTTTIDNGDELNLLFSNDSVVTLKSAALQGFEPGALQNSYRHRYLVTANQLDPISKFNLAGIRKYSFQKFTDLNIPQENAAKLKRLSALFIAELKKANILKRLRHIDLKDIHNYIGDSVEFCSKVYKTRYFEDSEGGPTLLDVQSDFSDPFVNVVIYETDRKKFNDSPEKKYLNKDVCISGIVTLRNNVPHLVLYSREQIKVKSPVSLEEISLFVGDSITTTGKVFTARYLEDTKTKPTLLNVGAPYPDQPLTLVIEDKDRKNFVKPEELYFGKTLLVSGTVVEFKGKPQIVLQNSNQVQIIADAAPVPATASLQTTTTATINADQPPAKKSVEKKEANNAEKTTKPPVKAVEPAPKEKEAPPKVKEATAKVEEPLEKKVPAQTFAEFPGGDSAFVQFIRRHIEIPEGFQAKGPKEVILSFDVDAKGVWRNMRLVTSAGKELDKALVRVLKKMPKWKPATQNGVAVPTQVVYPVVIFDPGIRSN